MGKNSKLNKKSRVIELKKLTIKNKTQKTGFFDQITKNDEIKLNAEKIKKIFVLNAISFIFFYSK